jgi:diphthamide biosynthesis protein 3
MEPDHSSHCSPFTFTVIMGAYYDEIEIEDMAWDEEKGVFHYPCPCGDRFEISRKQLTNCEDVATCPSCSLIIRVIYDPVRGMLIWSLNKIPMLSCHSWTLRMSLQMMRTPPRVRKRMKRRQIVIRTMSSRTRWTS